MFCLSELPRNKTGVCASCYEEVFDVNEVWEPNTAGRGSPLIGEVRRLGMAHDEAYRLAVVMSDGTQSLWTVCEKCLPKVNENLARIWAGVIRAFAFDWKAVPFKFGAPMAEEQLAHQASDLLRVASLAPLGVLNSERWVDLIEREANG
jgi:hypothetical protein